MTSPNELEGAVELGTALDWLRRKTSDGPHSARMADTILDALASITRERDAMREALIEARNTISRHQQELSAALVNGEGSDAS